MSEFSQRHHVITSSQVLTVRRVDAPPSVVITTAGGCGGEKSDDDALMTVGCSAERIDLSARNNQNLSAGNHTEDLCTSAPCGQPQPASVTADELAGRYGEGIARRVFERSTVIRLGGK